MKTPILAALVLASFVAQPARAQQSPPVEPAAPAAESGLRLAHLGLAGVAVGLLVVGVGVGFSASAGDDLDAARERNTQQTEAAVLMRDANEKLTRGNQLVLTGVILTAAGGALCLVDLLLPALRQGGTKVALAPMPGGAAASLTVRF